MIPYLLSLSLIFSALESSEGYKPSDMQQRIRFGWFKTVSPDSATAFLPKISGHSAATVLSPKRSEDGDHTKSQRAIALLFGGLTGPAGSPCTNETWEFLIPEMEWKKLPSSSGKPRIRMYAACAVLQYKFLLFGGWDPGAPGSGGEFLKDIWEFDIQTNDWKELGSKLPFPVSRHTACTVNDMIIVHTYKGIFVFRKDGSLTAQATTGDAPDGLSMCAAASLNDSHMLIFGGSTKHQQMSQDAYVLDTTSWKWTKLTIDKNDGNTSGPPKIASSCAAQVANNEIIIFGGASIGPTGYDGGFGLIPQNDTWKLSVTNRGTKALWEKVGIVSERCDNIPEGRVAASLCAIGPSSLLLQGGYNPLTKTTFEDPWILHLE